MNPVIEAARAQGRQTWPYEPLYLLLHASLPAWQMQSGILDVPALALTLNCTAESIYKWFRAGKLPAGRVVEIHALMLREDNLTRLTQAEKVVPEIGQLLAFSN